MKIEFDDSLVPHVIIKNLFSKKINQNIIHESLKLERRFTDGITGNNNLDKSIRSNQVCYYHDIYPNKPKIRESSPLLGALQKLYKNQNFRQLLSSCPAPLSNFVFTNTDEVQVSRYGNNKQKYEWHIDRFENNTRLLTIVYYFNKEPKKYTGGELLLSKNPIYKKNIVGKESIKTIIPENNMAVIFSSTVPHCVKPTISSDKFEDGRFSANIWLGIK